LAFAANLEISEGYNEKEIDHVKKDVSDFLEKIEEDFNEDSEPPKKVRLNILKENCEMKHIHWFTNPSDRTFSRLSSASNFTAK